MAFVSPVLTLVGMIVRTSTGTRGSPFAVLLWLIFAICVTIGTVVVRRQQRRAVWEEVLAKAHTWADSAGATLHHVSEQDAVYGLRNAVVARRYRVTLIDDNGSETVATLRYTCADATWSMEELDREEAVADRANPATLSEAESLARRHRGKVANVRVIFDRTSDSKRSR